MKTLFTWIFFSLLASLYFANASAQTLDVGPQKEEEVDTEDSIVENQFARIFMDERIYKLMEVAPKSGGIQKIRGFRVQIYTGNNRSDAENARAAFIRNFPGVPAYMVYTRPNFRVRVGNFRNRREAQEMMNKIGSRYTTMIVPEIIYYKGK